MALPLTGITKAVASEASHVAYRWALRLPVTVFLCVVMDNLFTDMIWYKL